MRNHLWLIGATSFCMSGGLCLASPAAWDLRENVEIIIFNDPTIDNADVNTAVVALERALRDDLFDVSVLRRPQYRPAEHFERHAKAFHIIADVHANRENGISATVYTRGQPPREFSADGLTQLITAINEHIESEEMVLVRLGLRSTNEPDENADADALYEYYLDRGLNHLLNTHSYGEAIGEFEKAIAQRPDAALPHYNLSLCYKRIGLQDKREQHVNLGLDRIAANSDAVKADLINDFRNEKALLLMTKDRHEEAIEILEELPQQNPTYLWNLAYAHSKIGETEQARSYLKKLIDLEASSEWTMVSNRRLDSLEDDLSFRTTALWIAAALSAIGMVMLVAVFARMLRRESPEVRVALKRQLALAALGPLASLLTMLIGLFLA